MNIDTALTLRETVLDEYASEIIEVQSLYDSIIAKSKKLPETADLKLYELFYDFLPLLEEELESTDDGYKVSWEMFLAFADAEYEYFQDWLTDYPSAVLTTIGRTSKYVFSSPNSDVNELYEGISKGHYKSAFDLLAWEVSILFEVDTFEKVIKNYEYIENILTYDEFDYINDLEYELEEVIYLLKDVEYFLDDALSINNYIESFKRNASENFLHYLELEDYLYLVDEIK